MKKTILLVALLIFTGIYAQTNDLVTYTDLSKEKVNLIKEEFTVYFNNVKQQDWEKVIDKMHPDFLEMMSRDNLILQMNNAFDNEIFTTSFTKMEIQEVKKTFSYEQVLYTKVGYSSSFTFHFKKTEGQTDEEFNVYVDNMTGIYNNQFKGQTITRKGDGIIVEGNKEILVIDNPDYEELKMLEYDSGLKMVYDIIFPKAVVTELTKE